MNMNTYTFYDWTNCFLPFMLSFPESMDTRKHTHTHIHIHTHSHTHIHTHTRTHRFPASMGLAAEISEKLTALESSTSTTNQQVPFGESCGSTCCVVVLYWWCIGNVLVMYWWCIGGALKSVRSWQCSIVARTHMGTYTLCVYVCACVW
jgi:hypothetical protein